MWNIWYNKVSKSIPEELQENFLQTSVSTS